MMEKQGKKKQILFYMPLLIVVFIIAAAALPFASIISNKLTGILTDKGVRLIDNVDDGQVIAEFEDITPILQPLPVQIQNSKPDERAPVIRKFAVKKVRFSKFAGAGIEARLNLYFEFQGILPNPQELKSGFSEPVIHVYIDAPGKCIAKTGTPSPRAACFTFGSEEWDFQVIIDGYHEQPRIFNVAGEQVGEGLSIYSRSEKNTKLTAALPLDIIGDPSYGDWSFIVMTGFTDLHSSAMIAAPAKEGEKGIYQYFKGMPLKIRNPL